MDTIFHYTSGAHLLKILSDGELIVSEWEKTHKVKPPALWLSLNPTWEPTATKLITENGKTRSLTMKEQHENFGLIRFVMNFDPKRLCSWNKYQFRSNTPKTLYRKMERSGIEKGANPKEWFASFENIQLGDCISYEKWDGNTWKIVQQFNHL